MPGLKLKFDAERLSSLKKSVLENSANILESFANGANTVQEVLREKHELVQENEQLKKIVGQINLRTKLIKADGKLSVCQAEFESFLRECGMKPDEIKELGRRMHQDN